MAEGSGKRFKIEVAEWRSDAVAGDTVAEKGGG
jgi:hypothetical protein